MVEELMLSNRRHAEKLHETLSGIGNLDYNTPAKKNRPRLRDRSTAESLGQHFY
jgi:hypothetical protein